MLTMHSTQSGQQEQMQAMDQNSTAMGEAFNNAQNDDTFYLPPEIFDNADFKRGMKNFISPDGHAVRFIISHEEDPLSAEGIKRIDAIKSAAVEAMKGTPLEGSKVYLGGTASAFKDMQEGNKYDLMIAGIAALILIFIIMLLITRALSRRRSSSAPWCSHWAPRSGCRCCSGSTCWARTALHGDGDGGDHPVGRRRRLQPAAGRADERGNPGRDQHRHHPGHGWQRVRRDGGRPGVRVHDDVHVGQRP